MNRNATVLVCNGGVDRSGPVDEELIIRLAAGDLTAFNTVFERYYKPIYNYVHKQIETSEFVDDITQEVFLRVLKSAKTFNVTRKFSSWIYTIALNEIRRHCKRSRSRQTYSLNSPLSVEGGDNERGDFIEDLRLAPAIAAEQELFSRNLKAMIDRLPEKQKTVVLLKVYSDLTFEQISAACECPLSTVLSRMRYAVRKLRRGLGVVEGESFVELPHTAHSWAN